MTGIGRTRWSVSPMIARVIGAGAATACVMRAAATTCAMRAGAAIACFVRAGAAIVCVVRVGAATACAMRAGAATVCAMRAGAATVCVLVACVTAATVLYAQAPDPTPVIPTGTANSVSAVLYVRPFTLEQPYRYLYTVEQPEITSGFLIVLEVDRELARPRDFAMPVLYVGTRPAELLSFGHLSGRAVAVVPGDTDLATAEAYFGSTELPERVDAVRGAEERAAARALGVRPFPAEMVEAARAAGGAVLAAPSMDAVYRAGGELILRYAPEEREWAEGYLLR